MQARGSSMVRPGVAQVIDELDVGAIGRALWRKKRWIIGLTLLAAGIALAGVNLVAPRYKSEARILIETRENIFLRPDAERSAERGTTVDQEAVTSQVQLILSRDLAREVVRTLKLGENPEFDPVLRGLSLVKAVLEHLGLIKDPLSQTPEERVLKSYFERLTAFQVDKSRVIAIEFESESPELAALATNTIAEAYLGLQRTAKQDQSRSASQWLAGEIETLRQKVAEAESKVEQHRSKSNLLVGTNNTTLSNQQLGEFNAQVGAARALRIDAESKARIIRETLRNGGAIEFSDIVNSELLRRLSEQRITLRAQLAEQSSTLLDQHPRIKELRAQIADLERQLRLEADRLARALENDARMADARMTSLSAGFDQLKFQAAGVNEQDVQLRAFERDAKSQRDLLESYLAKYREAAARDNIAAVSPEARVISSASVSNTPSYPKKLPTVLLAAFGMFLLSSGFVVSGQLLGAAPGMASRPASGANRPILASADRDETAKCHGSRLHASKSHSAAIQAVAQRDNARSIGAGATGADGVTDAAARPVTERAAPDRRPPMVGSVETIDQVASSLKATGGCRIAVFGTRQGVGTTQAAIALVRALAKENKVVLVDLALRSPNLAAIASDPKAPGLSEAVSGMARMGQIIVRDRLSPAHVIMAGHMTNDVAAIMLAPQLVVAIEALARSYDHVVVDAGALADIPTDRLAPIMQVAVLVCERADDVAATGASEQIRAAGFKPVRVVTAIQGGTDRRKDVDPAHSRVAA
jgi:polysaccharide biosynthesis transport protein